MDRGEVAQSRFWSIEKVFSSMLFRKLHVLLCHPVRRSVAHRGGVFLCVFSHWWKILVERQMQTVAKRRADSSTFYFNFSNRNKQHEGRVK
jgi:drug/metabolite transporter superfamily protein YnfA